MPDKRQTSGLTQEVQRVRHWVKEVPVALGLRKQLILCAVLLSGIPGAVGKEQGSVFPIVGRWSALRVGKRSKPRPPPMVPIRAGSRRRSMERGVLYSFLVGLLDSFFC